MSYKPSKKLLQRGEITARTDHFHEYGYEYTFYLRDHLDIVGPVDSWVQMNKRMAIKRFDDSGSFVFGFPGCLFEFSRVKRKEFTYPDGSIGYSVSYVGYFQSWYDFGGLYLGEPDDMNRMMTVLELTLLRIDPMTYVRTLPLKRHHKNHEHTSQVDWTQEAPDYRLTRGEALEKRCEEYYLADRINQTGIAVYGGTPMAQAQGIPMNPLFLERMQENEEYAAEKKIAEEKKQEEEKLRNTCKVCGAELTKGALFCMQCGTKCDKTEKELLAEEKGLSKYPPMFISCVHEGGDPFIFADIDENKNIVPEMQDHGFAEVPLASLTFYSKGANENSYKQIYSSTGNRDNFMYVSDSRVAFINRKYNKNEAGSWIGFGSASMFVVGELLNYAGKAVKAAQRQDKAFVGHLRYEWIGMIGFYKKQKMLESDDIRFVYMDPERTKWMVKVELPKGYDSEMIANDITRRVAVYRQSLNKEKSADEQAFIAKYAGGTGRIPREADPSKTSSEIFSGNCFASKGSFYRENK